MARFSRRIKWLIWSPLISSFRLSYIHQASVCHLKLSKNFTSQRNNLKDTLHLNHQKWVTHSKRTMELPREVKIFSEVSLGKLEWTLFALFTTHAHVHFILPLTSSSIYRLPPSNPSPPSWSKLLWNLVNTITYKAQTTPTNIFLWHLQRRRQPSWWSSRHSRWRSRSSRSRPRRHCQ